MKNYDLLLKRLSKLRPIEIPDEFNSLIEKTKKDVDVLPSDKKKMLSQFRVGYQNL